MSNTTIVLPSRPKVIKEEKHNGVYEIDGLYPGYGHTLGNALRRIILSSLPGTAITSLKIEGVGHEFSSIPGVKEDIIALILNLKKIRFRLLGNAPKALRLSAHGIKMVTAGDITVDDEVEVLNKDLPLATLTDKKSSLDIEMNLEEGLGYLSKEAQSRRDRSGVGTIYLDAVFTPIRRVSYEVENMRVGDRTDFNRLRINLETDGTIAPREALSRAISTMVEQLKAIIVFEEITFSGEEESSSADPGAGGVGETAAVGDKSLEPSRTNIEEIGLPGRVVKVLSSAGIRTLAGLARKKESDLREVEGLGERGIEEIKKALANSDLTLK